MARSLADVMTSLLPLHHTPVLHAHIHACVSMQDVGGIPPALSRLSYGGKAMEDAQRTLQQ